MSDNDESLKKATDTDTEADIKVDSIINEFSELNLSNLSISYKKISPKKTQTNDFKSLSDFESFLSETSVRICISLGNKNREECYQRSLNIEFKEAGIPVLIEQSIPIKYGGQIISSRRADLILKVNIANKAIFVVIEVKAVSSYDDEHLRQLMYYMKHFNIDHGYVVNFTHELGFPLNEIKDDESSDITSDTTNLKAPQIVYSRKVGKNFEKRIVSGLTDSPKPPYQTNVAPIQQFSPGYASSSPNERLVFNDDSRYCKGIAKSTGSRCRIKVYGYSEYCRHHGY